MATAQDVFPKVGGDPQYYTEANRFARAPAFISIGSTALLASGTGAPKTYSDTTFNTYLDAGSIFFSGALSTTNPVEIDFNFSINKDTRSFGILAFSGVGGNYTVFINGSIIAGQSKTVFGRSYSLIGSQFSGASFTILHSLSANDLDNAGIINTSRRQSSTMQQFNSGSPWVAFLALGSNTGDALWNYSVQAFRGAL